MATQSEKIQKLQDELKSLNDTLNQYHDMFKADGIVDSEEEKQLNAMKAVIAKAEAKLTSLSSGVKDETIAFTTTKMKEIGDFLDKLEVKFGIK